MSFINSLGRKISQTSQEVLQKTKETAEIIKYNNMISEEEKHLEQLFTCLGKEFYKQAYDTCLEIMPDTVAEIKESQTRIEGYQTHLQSVKGIILCPNCGKDLPPDVVFCSACGHRLESEETASSAAETQRTCPNCNAPMPEDFLFCIKCGTPYPQETPCTEETAPASEETPVAEPETESNQT
ncbi:MAG: zinc ribbon domain-containing protein [Oscillospiraceae bacterium]|nr:zinc ribbon domain-containing protein [Oscillospiraceae bacterium]